MKRGIAFTGEAILYAFAFAWPWSVYAYVPGLGLSLTTCLAAAMVLFALLDLGQSQRLRLPFELTWPLALVLVIAWGVALVQQTAWPVRFTGYAIVFAAVIQLAHTPARALQCLRLSALAGGCVAAITLLARAGYVLPTVVPLDSFGVYSRGWLQAIWRAPYLAFAEDWPRGVVTLTLCMLCGMYFFMAARETKAARMRALGDLVLPLFVLITAAPWLVRAVRSWRPEAFANPDGATWALIAVCAWLAARVAAKVEVDRLETHSGAHSGFLFILGFIALTVAAMPGSEHVAFVFFFGLAAAYAAPRAIGNAWSGRAVVVACVPVVALALYNVWHVDAGNTRDPRNYEVALRQDLAQGDLDRAWLRVQHWRDLTRDEGRMDMWTARIAMEGNQADAASLALVSLARDAAEASRGRGLPPPSVAEIDAITERMRDWASQSGDGLAQLAYCRVLVAMGRTESALALLKATASEEVENAPGLTVDPLAEAVARLLLDLDTKAPLMEMTPGRLLSILKAWGATVASAPSGAPASALPLVGWAQQTPEGPEVGFAAGGLGSVSAGMESDMVSGPGEAPVIAWSLTEGASGAWEAALDAVQHDQSESTQAVEIAADGTLHPSFGATFPAEALDKPSVQVWLR